MIEFYYDFSIDLEEKSILIGVDQEYEFKMTYPEDCEFSPDVKYQEDGSYIINFQRLYTGIDLQYILKSNTIKEYIRIHKKENVRDFSIKIDLEKCLIFKSKKTHTYKIIGKDGIEIFDFTDLNVIEEPHNKNVNFSRFAKIEWDLPKSSIIYRFSPKSFHKSLFPVLVDPTFRFQTKIKRNQDGFIRTSIDSQNHMIISGKTIADEFFNDAIGVPVPVSFLGGSEEHETPDSPYVPGRDLYKKLFIPDDVVYEPDCRLMFPYLTGLISDVKINCIQNNVEKSVGTFPIKTSTVNGVDYDYVDFKFPFGRDSSVRVDAFANFDKNQFGDLSVLYSRVFSHLPSVGIIFSNNKTFITKLQKDSGDVFSLGFIATSSGTTFKPYKFFLIPFEMEMPKADDGATLEQIKNSLHRQKDKNSTFLLSPKKVESSSYSLVRYYFDIPTDDWPGVKLVETIIEEIGVGFTSVDAIEFKRGLSQSFSNNVEFAYVSAVNDRSNIQENIDFKNPYTYVDPDDFFFDIDPNEGGTTNGRISLRKNPFKFFIFQKPTHFIDFKLNFRVSNFIDDRFSISKPSENEVTFSISKKTLKDFFIYSFRDPTTASDSNVNASIFLEFDDENQTDQDINLSEFEEDALKGYSIVFRSGGRIYSYEILSNNNLSVTFAAGQVEDLIKNADYIGIFPFLPDFATFVYDHINYDEKRSKLVKSSILDTGELAYEEVSLSIEENAATEISVNLKKDRSDFGGISKKVSIRSESLFYFFGFDSSIVQMDVFVDLNPNATLSNSNPNKVAVGSGGLIFNNFSIPSKFNRRILYLNIDADGFADKVALDVVDPNGNITEYTESVTDIIEFLPENQEENRFLEIRIDQKKINFSKITLKFINV